MTPSKFRDTLIDSGFLLGDAESKDDLDGMALCGTQANIHGFECTVRLQAGRDGWLWLALVDGIDDTFSSATADELADDIRAAILE